MLGMLPYPTTLPHLYHAYFLGIYIRQRCFRIRWKRPLGCLILVLLFYSRSILLSKDKQEWMLLQQQISAAPQTTASTEPSHGTLDAQVKKESSVNKVL